MVIRLSSRQPDLHERNSTSQDFYQKILMEPVVLEIRHLKTLHALREADSLVEAAERLHLTQSALSHQFKELEERLGMQLFIRKTKPVRFTGAGLRLLQLADATLP